MNTDLLTLPVGFLVMLAVLVLITLTLIVFALIDLYRRPAGSVTFGSKWIWLVLILCLNLLGPVLYFTVGRKPGPPADIPPITERSPHGANHIVDRLYGPPNHPDKN